MNDAWYGWQGIKAETNRKAQVAKSHFVNGCPFQVANALPRLPKNAVWYYSQQNSCVVGLGLVAELFASGTVKKADYNYFIVLTSAVRGPFIPGFSLVSPFCPYSLPYTYPCSTQALHMRATALVII